MHKHHIHDTTRFVKQREVCESDLTAGETESDVGAREVGWRVYDDVYGDEDCEEVELHCFAL